MAEKMRAAVLRGPGGIRLEERPIPEVRENELLVRVKACGICGSDIAYYRRGETEASRPPIVLGHEFAGEVVELGGAARRVWARGDRVVIEPVQSCGVCWACRRAMPNVCVGEKDVSGVSVDGGFAEYAKVSYRFVHRLPENVSYEEGALTEPLACAYYGVGKMRVSPGDFAVVIGPGPIGLMMVQLARARGAGRLAVIGTRDYRLEAAERLGADHVINDRDPESRYFAEDPASEIRRLTDGRGADAVIVATGATEANELALRLGGAGSRTVFFGGAGYSPQAFVKLPLWESTYLDKEYAFSWLAPYTFAPSLRAISTGLVKVKPLVTHTFPLEKTAEAIETAEKRTGNALKVQVKP